MENEDIVMVDPVLFTLATAVNIMTVPIVPETSTQMEVLVMLPRAFPEVTVKTIVVAENLPSNGINDRGTLDPVAALPPTKTANVSPSLRRHSDKAALVAASNASGEGKLDHDAPTFQEVP